TLYSLLESTENNSGFLVQMVETETPEDSDIGLDILSHLKSDPDECPEIAFGIDIREHSPVDELSPNLRAIAASLLTQESPALAEISQREDPFTNSDPSTIMLENSRGNLQSSLRTVDIVTELNKIIDQQKKRQP
ncbi:hypothetical protein CR956_00775, partial [Candidatus Saccharibacteria bacterium]